MMDKIVAVNGLRNVSHLLNERVVASQRGR
jgi:hypothetical protein